MKSTVLEGVHYWSAFQPDRNIDFNGWLWTRPAGNVAIDPMPLSREDVAFVEERGGLSCILVDNAEHLRASVELGQHFAAPLCAHAAERGRLGQNAAAIEHWFEDASSLPAGLAGDVEVIGLRGGKSPIEPAFYLKPLEAYYFGDAVRSHVSGELMLLPAPKLTDPAQLAADLATLGGRPVRGVLLGDGDPIFGGAAEAMRRLLARVS